MTGIQRFTHGLGCTVDVWRVGSYAAWLRSPEFFLTQLSFGFYLFLFQGA